MSVTGAEAQALEPAEVAGAAALDGAAGKSAGMAPAAAVAGPAGAAASASVDGAPRRRPTAAAVRAARVGILAAWSIPAYIAGIVLAEAVVAVGAPVVGTAIDGLVLLVALNHYALTAPAGDRRRRGTPIDALPVLALLPMLRILSLALPLGRIPAVAWYVAIGGPLLVAALMTAAQVGLTIREL